MSIEKARAWLKKFDADSRIVEFPVSSATVELAAEAVGCEPARIAKTLSFRTNDGVILIVAAGDAKINNPKYKLASAARRVCSPLRRSSRKSDMRSAAYVRSASTRA